MFWPTEPGEPMRVVRSLEARGADSGADTVLAIGFFDGLHLGHQRVINLAQENAAARHAQAWVMTFDPHPLKIVQPSQAPLLITTLEQKLELLAARQLDGCAVIPFTRQLAEMTPEEFLADLMRAASGLRGIVIGENWRFGRHAKGDVALLRVLGREHGLEIIIAEPVQKDGQTVSSTRIREAIAEGRLDEAHAMLGRRHALPGRVINGAKRGRKLGFPTANLDLRGMALPPHGIYAGRVRVDGHTFDSALYRPANSEGHGMLEAHVLDFQGNLYDQILHVEFIARIREDNLRFTDEAALIAQIGSDVRAIRDLLEKTP